jgi:hypothetical protein
MTRGPLARLRADEWGVSAVEFALILPVLVGFAIGTMEFGRLILLHQKLQNGAFILADLTARERDETLSVGSVEQIFLALDDLLEPFDVGANGRAVVTSVVGNEDEEPVIRWQLSGAGTFSVASQLGEEGEVADLPDLLTVSEGETIIVAEVFYDFEPLFGLNAGAATIRKVSYYKPRLGTLDTLLP